MDTQFVTVARLRAEMASVLARLGERGPLYLTQRGRPRAVLLDVDEYRGLIDQIEYLDDSLEALHSKDARQSGKESTRPLAAVVRERGDAPVKRVRRPRARTQRARISR